MRITDTSPLDTSPCIGMLMIVEALFSNRTVDAVGSDRRVLFVQRTVDADKRSLLIFVLLRDLRTIS